MKKRIWSILLVLCMALTLLPFGALAADNKAGENLTWSDIDGLLIISGQGKMYDYEPGTQPWADRSLNGRYLMVEEGVTHVGANAFADTGIREASLSSTLKSIGENAFCGSGLTRVMIPGSVRSIGSSAFANCEKLTEADLQKGIPTIPAYAFSRDTALRKVWIPVSVTTIEAHAFDGCSALANVYYGGTRAQWKALNIEDAKGSNAALTKAIAHCKDGDVPDLPVITVHPQDAAAKRGEKVVFSVEATGKDLTYQWQYCIPGSQYWNDSTMPGAKTAQVTVMVADKRDGQLYRCKVSNAEGTVISHPAMLMMIKPPSFLLHPQSVTVAAGEKASFYVDACGGHLTYQWQYLSPGSEMWKNSTMPGADSEMIIVPATAARNGQQYRCVLRNDAGAAYSLPAKLTVVTTPVITAQPQDVALQSGSYAELSVTAVGSDLRYQWQYKVPGATGWDNSGMPGANTARIRVEMIPRRDGQQYRCKITNRYGTVISEPALLDVVQAPTIRVQPMSATVAVGETAHFEIQASGPNLHYQWQYKVPGAAGWDNSGMPGANSPAISVPGLARRDGQQYRCKVTNADGTVISVAVRLNVH